MRKIYFLLLTVLFAAISQAQINLYSFSQSSGTYTPISGGFVIVSATDPLPSGLDSAAMDDFTYAEYALPFSFNWGGTNQTSFRVNSNGWLGFGAGTSTTTTTPISTSNAFNGVIAPFGADLMGLVSTIGTTTSGSNTITAVGNTAFCVIGAPINGTGIPTGSTITAFTATTITISANATSSNAGTFISWCTGEIRAETQGVAPNRTFIVQFSGLSQYNTTAAGTGSNSFINFQIRLSEGGGIVGNQTASIVYGTSQHPGTAQTGQVGLRGSVNTDFNNRTTTTDWSATTAGGTNAATVSWGPTVVPASGLTYMWTPPPPCTAPSAQPTALNLIAGINSISGSFTAAVPAPTGYLIVRTTVNTAPVPVDGTTYSVGNSAIGFIESAGTATSFNSTGLNQSTQYYYWVFSYNNTSCTGGPVYLIASPLSNSATTGVCTISGTKTVGPTGDYSTLTAAVSALVTNGITTPIVLELQTTYTSAGETFPIVLGNVPCASATNTVTIRPAAGAVGLVITSANATATLDINNGSYWIVDGRPGGTGVTSQLTISNTATGTASDIRYINDASNNVITYCSLLGSTSSTNGIVFFSTGTITGNDGNTISNNSIGVAGVNFPLNGVFSLGTSAAIDNSGNTISGNNIFDVFSAASVYNGINLSTGNSGWTISNNRIYQTASRTITTANTETGINIGAGVGYTISGNIIGYATATGTGTMTMTSTVALRYIGINCAFTAGGTVSNIQGNIIASISMTTSSSAATANGNLCGINVTTGNVNIDNNTIGATTGTGSLTGISSAALGAVVGINSSSVNTVTITNNNLGSFTSIGTTATIGGSVNAINVSGAAASMTITGNTIGNSTANNMLASATGASTSATVAIGINATSVCALANFSNNTIQNFASLGTGTGNVRGIFTGTTSSTTAVYTISNNTITNLSTNSSLTSATSGLTAGAGIHYFPGINSVISDNTISNIAGLNTGAVNTVITGIACAQATNPTYTRNRIFNITNASTATSATAPGVVAGFTIRSGTTGITIVNNMVSLGNGQTTNTAFVGIWGNHGSTPDPTDRIYYNSVNIEGTAASGAQPSFGFFRGDFSATARTAPVDIKNNIFNNTRSGGTGKHYAIANNYGATTSATNWGANASNYNALNAAVSTIGYWTTDQTFAGWKVASNGDVNSVSGVPVTFTNTAAGDLHLNMGLTPTQLESGGVVIAGITTDYDNQLRPGPAGSVNGGAFAPDLGADEFDGVPLDLFAPTIVYTPLPFTCGSGARTLVATITDVSGVPTSGPGLPVLYWRINAGAYTAATATYLGSNQYQFSFGAGAVLGDVVSYYIVAQDNATPPNVGSFPSAGAGGFSANPPAAATPPTTPSSYSINGTINGTYSVGVGQTYTTLTAAVNAYNNSCLTGAVVFNLVDATYPSETFPIIINQNATASAVNTLTIKPGSTATISGASASGALIRILGNYVTIDGSNSGGTSRDLTITNTSTTSPSVILIGSTGTTPVTNSGIKNSIVINGVNTSTAIVVSDGATLGAAGYFNNITIQNNSIQKAYMGNYNIAVVAPGNGSGLTISNNDINTSGANAVRYVGIYVQGIDGATVSGNNIGNFETTSSENKRGVWFATGSTNSVAEKNIIHDIKYTGTSGYGAYGVAVSTGLANANVSVRNNMIYGLSGDGDSYASNGATYSPNGVYAFGTGQGGVNIYYNTIYLSGNTLNFASDAYSIGIALDDGSAANVKNNVILNNLGRLSTVGGGAIAIAAELSASQFTSLDNNSYFSGSTGSGVNLIGKIGASNYATLAAFQAATGQDANSINFQPTFVSATDLHLSTAPGANWCLNGSGVVIPGITTDIDGNTRSTGTAPNGPDMGADEFDPTGLVINNPATVCPPNTVDLTAPAITAGSVGGLTFTYYTDAAGTIVLANPNAVAVAGTYYIKATNGSCSLIKPVVVTFYPSPSTFTVTGGGAYCSGGPGVPVGLSGSAVGVNYQLQLNAVNTGSPVAGTGAAISFGNQTAAGTYTVVATNATTSCTATMTGSVNVTINPLPTISGALTQPTTCISTDGAITLTLGGAPGPYTFAWTGPGVNPTSQDQANLAVGNYSVIVTSSNTCSASASFTLVGPGNCSVCPTIPNLTTNPTPATCVGNTTTLTASGLTDMGITYGITFKYSASVLPNPYTGGTVIGTVPNGSLTSGGTVATTTTTFPAAGNYIVYAILSPLPLDPSCRPFAQTNITVNSTPTIVCPSNIIVSNTAGQCGAVVNYPPATVTGVPAPTVTYSTPSGSTFPVGTTTVTVTATNSCGTAQCTFTVRVNDTQPPTITCPANITVSNTPGQCSAVVNFTVTASDNCPGVTVVSSPASGSAFPRGTTTVTSTATDASGNTATCTFTVTVNDTQAPTVTCPANIVVNNTAGQCGAAVTFNVTATDNCPGVTVVSSPASGTVFPVGLTTVTSTATDGSGNTATCTFTVRVNDVQAPVITCPGNITAASGAGCTAIVNYTVTATDNCPGVTTSLVSGLASGSAFPTGVTTVTYRATDASGNSATCSFTVTVTDGQLPVITVQPANRSVCTGSNAVFSVTATNAVSYQWQQWNGTAWVNVSGATGSTLTINNVTTAMNTNTFRVLVNGACSNLISGNATLFVNPLPTISLSASQSTVLSPGQTVSITAVVSPGGGTIVWYKDGAIIPGATSFTLANLTVNDIGTYRAVYTDPNGCVSTSADLVLSGQALTGVFVYPVPNFGQFNVRVFATGSTSPLTVIVYDEKGSKVYQRQYSTSVPYTNMDVNLGDKVSSGTYLVEVRDGDGKRIGARGIVVRHN